MTDREKAIVMAYTGICMLAGDKFQIFHKYVEDIMGRPIMTHEIGFLENEIKEKSKADFIALCDDESSSENPNKWIPVSERLPEEFESVLDKIKSEIETEKNAGCHTYYAGGLDFALSIIDKYKAESEDKE